MSTQVQDEFSRDSGLGTGEDTLRLLARLPAPEGLEDRMRTRLRGAPRTGRLLAWPASASGAMGLARGWMRGAAAAAIVCVVAGGSWSVYSRVPIAAPARAVVAPHGAMSGSGAGGFSNSGAMRTPQTLNGPVVQPAEVKPPPDRAPAKKAESAAQHRRVAGAAGHPSANPPALGKTSASAR